MNQDCHELEEDHCKPKRVTIVASGRVVNLTRVESQLQEHVTTVDTYGANVDVEYVSAVYNSTPLASGSTSGCIPFIAHMGPNDAVCICIEMQPSWFDRMNVLVFTPYAYRFRGTTTFASVDASLFLTPSSFVDGKVHIWCSALKRESDVRPGHFASRIPADWLHEDDDFQFTWLLRVGTSVFMSKGVLSARIQTEYVHVDIDPSQCPSHWTAREIAETLPPYSPVIDTPKTRAVRAEFQQVVARCRPTHSTYPYMSNYTVNAETGTWLPVHGAVESLYADVQLTHLPIPRALVELRANNTCENYFMSNCIYAMEYEATDVLCIVWLNQNRAGATLTSDVQLYDAVTHNELENGQVLTGPELPPLSSWTLDASDCVVDSDPNCPPYGIARFFMGDLARQTCDHGVVICERLSYGLVHAGACVDYAQVDSCHWFVCSDWEEQVKILSPLIPPV